MLSEINFKKKRKKEMEKLAYLIVEKCNKNHSKEYV